MEICNFRHDEIVFNNSECPACNIRDYYQDEMSKKEQELSDKIDELERKLDQSLNT